MLVNFSHPFLKERRYYVDCSALLYCVYVHSLLTQSSPGLVACVNRFSLHLHLHARCHSASNSQQGETASAGATPVRAEVTWHVHHSGIWRGRGNPGRRRALIPGIRVHLQRNSGRGTREDSEGESAIHCKAPCCYEHPHGSFLRAKFSRQAMVRGLLSGLSKEDGCGTPVMPHACKFISNLCVL